MTAHVGPTHVHVSPTWGPLYSGTRIFLGGTHVCQSGSHKTHTIKWDPHMPDRMTRCMTSVEVMLDDRPMWDLHMFMWAPCGAHYKVGTRILLGRTYTCLGRPNMEPTHSNKSHILLGRTHVTFEWWDQTHVLGGSYMVPLLK
jgi:hypothetical protein